MSKPTTYQNVDEGQPLIGGNQGGNAAYAQNVMQPQMVTPQQPQMQMMQPQMMQTPQTQMQMQQPMMAQNQQMMVQNQMQMQQPMMAQNQQMITQNQMMMQPNPMQMQNQNTMTASMGGDPSGMAQQAAQRQQATPQPFVMEGEPIAVDWQTYNRGYEQGAQLSVDGFEGTIDDQGMRQGRGKQTYPDGSQYDGEWANNMRQGYGEFQSGNELYKGYWMNDLKHGQGELFVGQDEQITGSWMNGHLDGQAKINKNGTVTQASFILGSQLPVKNSQVAGDRVIWEAICSLFFYAMIPVSLFVDPYFAFVALYFYICLLCYGMNNKFNTVLGQTFVDEHDPIKCVQNLTRSPLIVSMKIANYHWVTRRTKNGTRRSKRYTHFAEQRFHYSQWTDTSSPIEYFQKIDDQGLVRVKLHLDVEFSKEVSNRYCLEKHYFKTVNIMDTHYDFTETISVDKFEENKDFLFLDQGKKPCYLNFKLLVFMQVIGLGWIMRLIFQCKSKKADVKIGKLIMA